MSLGLLAARTSSGASWRFLALFTLGFALWLAPREARACACCDGTTQAAPLGWNDAGELLVKTEEIRQCERRLVLQVYAAEKPKPLGCYDLLGEPETRIPCAKASVGFDAKEQRSKAADAFSHGPTSVSPLTLRAHYTVKLVDGFRKATLQVFVQGSAEQPLLKLDTHEYPYASVDTEPTLLPLEVSVLPSPLDPTRAVVFVRGMDSNPGIGQRDFVVRWVKLPPGVATTPGVSWARALPRYGSLRADIEGNPAQRENGAGLKALSAGRIPAARGRFENAVALDPSHALSRYNLACTLARQRAVLPALEQLQELLLNAPEDVRKERKARALLDPDLEVLRERAEFQKLVCDGPCPPLPAATSPAVASAPVSAGSPNAALAPTPAPAANSAPAATPAPGVVPRDAEGPGGCAVVTSRSANGDLGLCAAFAFGALLLRRRFSRR